MSWTDGYLRLRFLMGGRARPAVDCWGLYRLIVGERAGVWLDEFGGVESYRAIARTVEAERGGWRETAAGEERPLDAVLMRGLVGQGRQTVAVALHIGCVVEPGLMIDIDDGTGVMVRAFRSTPTRTAKVDVANRVIGIFRASAIA